MLTWHEADRAHNIFPASAGTYVLALQALQERRVVIGRLGEMLVSPGFYVYLGSALGPGGLSGRLRYHLRPVARPHWHIDYLRPAVQLCAIGTMISPQRLECAWARAWSSLPGAVIPLERFGASDCGCPAHLIYLRELTWIIL